MQSYSIAGVQPQVNPHYSSDAEQPFICCSITGDFGEVVIGRITSNLTFVFEPGESDESAWPSTYLIIIRTTFILCSVGRNCPPFWSPTHIFLRICMHSTHCNQEFCFCFLYYYCKQSKPSWLSQWEDFSILYQDAVYTVCNSMLRYTHVYVQTNVNFQSASLRLQQLLYSSMLYRRFLTPYLLSCPDDIETLPQIAKCIVGSSSPQGSSFSLHLKALFFCCVHVYSVAQPALVHNISL